MAINEEQNVGGENKDVLDLLPEDADLITKINSWLVESKEFYSTLFSIQKNLKTIILASKQNMTKFQDIFLILYKIESLNR